MQFGIITNISMEADKARLFLLCCMQSIFDCLKNGAHAQPVGFSVAIGRTCSKVLIAQAGPKIVVREPAKKLKHLGM
jgi:hypothetical protein